MADRNWLKGVAAGALLAAPSLLVTGVALAQFVPSSESLSDLYPGKAYSPYAQRRFPNHVFWGDIHFHSNFSQDVMMQGIENGPDDCYRYGRDVMGLEETGRDAQGRVIAYWSNRARFSIVDEILTATYKEQNRAGIDHLHGERVLGAAQRGAEADDAATDNDDVSLRHRAPRWWRASRQC